MRYAQLFKGDIVGAISELAEEVVSDNLIFIGDSKVEHGSKYNRSTQTFSPPENSSTFETSIEEQILAENQYQTALLEMQMLGGNV